MRRKSFLKKDYIKNTLIFFIGFTLGVISIWPNIISAKTEDVLSIFLKMEVMEMSK